jgi:hypothetical protein
MDEDGLNTGANLADIRRLIKAENKSHYLSEKQYLIENQIDFSEPQEGVLVVKNGAKSFYYYYKAKKWRVGGNKTMYICKGVHDLCTRFVFK